jgi:hypothetical protein
MFTSINEMLLVLISTQFFIQSIVFSHTNGVVIDIALSACVKSAGYRLKLRMAIQSIMIYDLSA